MHSTVRSLEPVTEEGVQLLAVGGPKLKHAIDNAERCGTGEVVVTAAGALQAKFVS